MRETANLSKSSDSTRSDGLEVSELGRVLEGGGSDATSSQKKRCGGAAGPESGGQRSDHVLGLSHRHRCVGGDPPMSAPAFRRRCRPRRGPRSHPHPGDRPSASPETRRRNPSRGRSKYQIVSRPLHSFADPHDGEDNVLSLPFSILWPFTSRAPPSSG